MISALTREKDFASTTYIHNGAVCSILNVWIITTTTTKTRCKNLYFSLKLEAEVIQNSIGQANYFQSYETLRKPP